MKNNISARQLCAAGFTGALSLSAAAAWVDWRGALLAVPVVVIAVWAAARGAEERGGLLNLRGGKPLAILYIVWAVFLAGVVLALCGGRMGAAGAGQWGAGGAGGIIWRTALALLPAVWLALGKPEAFARAAEIFYLAMAAVLAFVVLLGAGQVEKRWLLAPGEDIWRSALTAAGIGCTGVYAVLLWNGQGEGEKRRWLGWTAAGGALLAVLSALTVGSLSHALAAAVERPFFVMTVGLGRTARAEALVAALWLVPDVTLLGLFFQDCRNLWKDVLDMPGEKWAAGILAAAALALAVVLEKLGAAEDLLREAVPLGGLLLGGLVPAALCLVKGKAGK